jgi:hypothetical protein
MPLSDKYAYPRVKIVHESEAWEVIEQQAAYYGKTEGELIGDIAIAWTKMLKGEWNLHWPVFMANVTNNSGNGAGQTPFPGSEETRRKREEDEKKQQERMEARKAAARAELLDS